MGHRVKDCPKKESRKEEEVHNIDRLADEDEFRKNVTLRYSGDDSVAYVVSLNALLDTGSPISLVKNSFIANPSRKDVQYYTDKFSGINNSKLVVLGTVEASVTLDNITKNNIVLIVVPDNTMASDIVLGRNALRKFNLALADKGVTEENEAISAIMNIDTSSQEQNITESLEVDETVSVKNKLILSELFTNHYVNPVRPESPEVMAELKLNVKDS